MTSRIPILLLALAMASSARADSCPHPARVHTCNNASDFPLCTANAFVNPDTNFNPEITPDNRYTPPTCNMAAPPIDPAAFQPVYDLLNPTRSDVSSKLCNSITNLFVTTGGAQDFGIWEVPAGTLPDRVTHRPARAQGVMYIAVHPDANVGHNLAYQENKMLAAAFAPKPVPAGLEYVSVDGTGDGMALLSILAHELGHLLLAETNADGTGGHGQKHGRSNLCDTQQQRPNPQTCFDDDFLAFWDTDKFHHHMRRWINFGGRNNNKYLDLNHDLDEAIRTGNYRNFLDGEFVSFGASASPEEDLVETYKYMILAEVAQASNLQLKIPGVKDPVPVLEKVSGPTAGSNLKKKIDCVNKLKPLF